MSRHKTSIFLFATAVAVYLLIGLLLPQWTHTPDTQVEAGWNAVQAIKGLAEMAAPFVALVLAVLAAIAFLNERKS